MAKTKSAARASQPSAAAERLARRAAQHVAQAEHHQQELRKHAAKARAFVALAQAEGHTFRRAPAAGKRHS